MSRAGRLTFPAGLAIFSVLFVFGQVPSATLEFRNPMYAIIRIGGHQYRAEPGKTIRIQSL
ncbi:MAG: bL21 family ribosomal protein, partial [Gemmatimonadetes bacterium]|nr:bL21 family ribosomal protein [Gemmatimonadota bacterium]